MCPLRILCLAGALLAGPAAADCQSEIAALGDDLKDIVLTEAQKLELYSVLKQARNHCWVKQEEEALAHINRARALVGLEPATGEFDWENVPLESLEADR